MNEQKPPDRAPKRLTRQDYRSALAVCTGLFILSMVTACLPSKKPDPTSNPPPQNPPVATTPTPPPPMAVPPKQPVPPPKQETPPPKQETPAPNDPPQPDPKPLPALPTGEPSRLVDGGDRSCKQIALTFDAGSGADGAEAILDALKKHHLTSTFFLTGKWVEKYPTIAKRIAAEGHEIANHTYSHPDLTKLPAQEVLQQLHDGEVAIRTVTGRETRPLFREPYGAFNSTERRLVRQAGFSYSIYWDVDTLDWQFPSVDTIVSRIVGKSKNGSIVLMHLNVPDTSKAIDRAIPMLQEKGYKLVTVTQVLHCP